MALFEARVPQNPLCLSLFSSFHCHLLVSKNTNVQTNQNLPSRKPTNSRLARSEGTHSYKVLLLCFYNSIYLYMIIPTTSPTVNLMNWSSFVTWGPKGRLPFDARQWIHRHGFHGQTLEDHQQTVRRILKLPSKSWGSRAPPCIMTIMNHVSNIFQQLIAIFHQLMAMD